MAVKRAKTTRRSETKQPRKNLKAVVAKPPAARKKVAKSAGQRPAAKAAPRPAATRPKVPSGAVSVVKVVEGALDEMKAVNVRVLNVRKLTDIADTMVIASGNSDRHVRSIADRVIEHTKKAGFRPMGVEGERDGEWVLVDLQDVIVHIMLPRVREFYRLESLWDVSAARREAAGAGL